MILSATFALTNVVTVSATSGDDAANLSSSQEEAAQETSAAAEESTDESGAAASEAAEEVSEDAPLFEKVNPEDEDYLNEKEVFEGDVTELPVEEKDPEEQTRVIIVMKLLFNKIIKDFLLNNL